MRGLIISVEKGGSLDLPDVAKEALEEAASAPSEEKPKKKKSSSKPKTKKKNDGDEKDT